MAAIIIGLYTLSTSFALVLLKLGSVEGAPIQFLGDKIQLNLNAYNAIGIFLYGASFLIYLYLISKYDLGYIIPLVTALVYIVILICYYINFKETISELKILAIALILVGLVLLNVKK